MAYKSKYTGAEIEAKLDLVYNKYFNPVVPDEPIVPDEPVEPEPLPLGVFIQHVDGSLYTEIEWTAKGFASADANGVAVSAEECAFVIAKDSLGKQQWGSLGLITDIMVSSDAAIALTDINGVANTEAMEYENAAWECKNFTFPNGKKGYLPALGEWAEAYKYKEDINTAISLVGGKALGTSMWSSTQYSADYAWLFGWSSGTPTFYKKNFSFDNILRAATTL